MKRPRVKLALLAGLAVALVMVAATIAFNLFIGWKIESDAQRDIAYEMGWNDEDTGTGRVPNYCELDSSYQIDESQRPWSAKEEYELAEWFSKHPTEGVVTRVQLGDWTCYAAIDAVTFVDDPPFGYGNEEDGYLLVYVDITSEQSMIASVNGTFAVIAGIGVIIAALAGYLAGRRIERAQESQKRFYENMSHELKTPLAAIRGYAEGAGSGVVPVGEAMVAIDRETGKMTDMIEEILGLSRLEAGAVTLHCETVAVGDFVQDCLMPFEGTVRTRNLRVGLALAPGTVEADPDLFYHALSNVLSNAMRHASSTVNVVYDGARLAIWNDGGAPSAEQQAHLFDRFYAAEGGSTGIGLAIAREIAVRHGWSIAAQARNGGLEISFTFRM